MIQTVYNHLAAEYVNRQPESSLKRVHKRSELRTIYNAIIRISRTTPLYQVNLIPANQSFALGLKEASMNLASSVDELVSSRDQTVFNFRKAFSGNEKSAQAELVSTNQDQYPEAFRLKVEALASTQVNRGLSVPKRRLNPPAGGYAFTVRIDEKDYEFQYNIRSDSTNEENLKKLSNFINQQNLGIHASIESQEEDTMCIILESEDTGNTGEPIFKFEDVSADNSTRGLVEYYGLDQITRPSSNAVFTMDGKEEHSLTNHVLINKTMQLSFLELSDSEFEIGYLPDDELILKRIENFQNKYNKIIDLAQEYSENPSMRDKLIRNLTDSTAAYRNEMEAAGISFDQDHHITLNDSLAREAIEKGDMKQLFAEGGFTASLIEQSHYVTLNPMDYVDKKLITYPNIANPGFSHPYVTSLYSGMIFNFYC